MTRWRMSVSVVNAVWLTTVVALAANAVAGLYTVGELLRSQRGVTQSRKAQAALADVLIDMVDAETGHRGFYITQNPEYRQPYEQALKDLPGHRHRVRELVAGDPEQTGRLAALDEAIDERLRILDESDKKILAGKADPLPNQIKVTTGPGKRVMDLVRAALAEMTEAEVVAMRAGERAVNDRFWRTVLANLVGTALALAVVSVALVAVRRELRQRIEAERQARAANDRLEATVVTRTKALTQTSNELLRSNQDLEKFAYVASHDLQEPLRKIQAFGDRLKQKAGESLDATGRDYVDRMQSSATRMRTLITDLLTFSRVATQARAFAKVDLAEIVAGVVSDLETRLDACGGRIDIGDLPRLYADPTQMRQLFQNLFSNALKFRKTDVPPTVVVRATPATDLTSIAVPPPPSTGWRITVTDNGIGFDPAYAERIFELFQRLHGRGEYEGTGIGLAVCRKIVERHGGRIVAHGRPDEGAQFVIDLPDLTESSGVKT